MVEIKYIIYFFLILFLFRSSISLDFASPCVIYLLSFIIGLTCSWYLGERWDLSFINEETCFLMVSSAIIFVVIDLLADFYFRKKVVCKTNFIHVDKRVLIALMVVTILSITWNFSFIFPYIKAGDWNAIMALYKDTVNTNIQELGISRFLLSQLNKPITALNYVLLYVFINNRKINKFKDSNLYKINFLLFIVFKMLFTGGRQTSLFFFLGWITTYYIFEIMNNKKEAIRKVNIWYFSKLSLLTLVLFPIFYFWGRFLGRKEDEEVLYAATGYLSTGILGLNSIVTFGYSSNYFGEISFPGLYGVFKLLDLMPESLENQSFLPFFSHGNTVSLLGRWYWDFGSVGTYVMLGLYAIVFAVLYYKNIKYSIKKSRPFYIIVYSYIVHILFFASYDDFSFNIPTLNFILTYIIIYIFYRYIIERKMILKGY